MNMGKLEQQADKGLGPVASLRLKVLGPRANGASMVKGYFYLSLACIALAINSQCSSREWARYAKANYRPNYVFMDPTGAAYLVEMPKENQPVVSEDSIRAWIWMVTKAQFEAIADTAGSKSRTLVDFYLDGDALQQYGKVSDNPNVLGSGAEKAELITTGRYRELELRAMFLRDTSTLSDGAQKINAEVMFFARTYNRGTTEPEMRRAYRVQYDFTIMSPMKPGLDLRGQREFLTENPIRLRVQGYHLQEENPGIPIPAVPENQSPAPGPQSQALMPTGATPAVPAAAIGGPATPLATSGLMSPSPRPTPPSAPRPIANMTEPRP